MTKMLKKTLENILTKKESQELISAFDQIGDIIIVRIPDSLIPKKKIIGKALLEQVKTANSVFYVDFRWIIIWLIEQNGSRERI